ncbi:retrovirus-related Pol polyprotein from transposon TNT 1-94, partial [Trifolium medium]|nr:retrovirus-related Pol polyprotein from transposon TNT 1-94 [Trifolium medium]
SIGDPIKHRDQLEAILDGLPNEYNALTAIIQYRSDLCPIVEAEAMLLAHEAKLEKSKKVVLSEPLSVNVAHVPPILPIDSIGSSSAAPHPFGGDFCGGRGCWNKVGSATSCL